MHAFKLERLQEKRAWSLINELHHIHRELVLLLDLVGRSPKTAAFAELFGRQQREDARVAQRLAELSLLMGRKPSACECPKAVELLADVLLAYRTLLRKHASGTLVIAALRSLRAHALNLWAALTPILPATAEQAAVRIMDDLKVRANRLLDELPEVELSALSTGGHRSFNT